MVDKVTDWVVWKSIRKANGGQEEIQGKKTEDRMKSTGIVEYWKVGRMKVKKSHPISPFGEPFGPGLTAEGLMSCPLGKEGGVAKAGEDWGT